MGTFEETLPDGWLWMILGEVIDKVPLTGKKLKQKEYQPDGKFPVIDQGKDFIGGYTNKKEIIISCETPCLVFGDHTKVVKYVDFDFVAGADGVKVIKPYEFFYSKLFFYFVKAIEIPDKGYARHFQYLEKSSIPLPPLPEQHRIVAKIEELFTKLDAGVDALKKTQAQLKRYRQSVLKYAFEGKLTQEWRESHKSDIEPASVLLERIKEEINKDKKKKSKEQLPIETLLLPEGWINSKLEHLIYIAGRIGWRGLKAEEYTQEGPLFLSVYNLNKGNYVDFSEVYHVSEERYDESPEIQLKNDDILLVKDGSGIGKLGIVKGLKQKATVNSSLLVIRAGKFFVPKYLFYFLKGPNMQRVVKERITGSATPHLFQRDIKKFQLLIPSIKEQEIIIEEIERRLSVADEVEKTVEQSLKQAERLRQSILKRAFEGKLVVQDPDDKPASVLLERIKAEKVKRDAEGKAKKKNKRKIYSEQVKLV